MSESTFVFRVGDNFEQAYQRLLSFLNETATAAETKGRQIRAAFAQGGFTIDEAQMQAMAQQMNAISSRLVLQAEQTGIRFREALTAGVNPATTGTLTAELVAPYEAALVQIRTIAAEMVTAGADPVAMAGLSRALMQNLEQTYAPIAARERELTGQAAKATGYTPAQVVGSTEPNLGRPVVQQTKQLGAELDAQERDLIRERAVAAQAAAQADATNAEAVRGSTAAVEQETASRRALAGSEDRLMTEMAIRAAGGAAGGVADEAPRPTPLQALAGGVFGRGYNPGAPFSAADAVPNLVGTVGVLARYGAAGVAIAGIFKTLSEVRTQYLDYQRSLANLADVEDATAGHSINLNDAIKAGIPAGEGAADAINTAAEAVARYGDEIRAGADASAVATRAVRDVGVAMVLTGQDAKTSGEQLFDATQGFQLGSTGGSRILDSIENARRNFGGDRAQIQQAVADAADLASSAGIDPEQLANIMALVQARTGSTASAVASAFERTVSRSGTSQFGSALSALGIPETGDLIQEITQLSAAYQRLTPVEQQHLVSQLGGARQAKELLPLLQDGTALVDANATSYNNAGAAAAYYERSQATLAGQLRQVGGELRDIALQFAQSGLLDVFGIAIEGLRPLLGGVDELLRLFNELPGPIRGVYIGILELALAARLLRSEGLRNATSTLFGRVPGVNQVLGPAPERTGAKADPQLEGAEAAGAAITEAGETFSAQVIQAAESVAVALRDAAGVASTELADSAAVSVEAATAEAAAITQAGETFSAQAVEAAESVAVALRDSAAAVSTELTEGATAAAEAATGEAAAITQAGEIFSTQVLQASESVVVALRDAAGVASAELAEGGATAAAELVAGGAAGATEQAVGGAAGAVETGLGARALAVGAGTAGGLATAGIGLLTNPITWAIAGLIAIGGTKAAMDRLHSAADHGAEGLDELSRASSVQDYVTAASNLEAARAEQQHARSGFFGHIASGLGDLPGGSRNPFRVDVSGADERVGAQYARDEAARLSNDRNAAQATLATQYFGTTGTDVGAGVHAMSAAGYAPAEIIAGAAQATSAATVASATGRPSGLIYNEPTLAGIVAAAQQVLGKNADPRELRKAAIDALARYGIREGQVIPPKVRDAIVGALVASQYGQLQVDPATGKPTWVDPSRGASTSALQGKLNALSTAGAAGGGPLNSQDLTGILEDSADGSTKGLISTIDSFQASPFDVTGGEATYANAYQTLRRNADRVPESERHGIEYEKLIAEMNKTEAQYIQVRVANLERLRNVADAQNAGNLGAIAGANRDSFGKEIATAIDSVPALIQILGQMTQSEVDYFTAEFQHHVEVAQAAVNRDTQLRNLIAHLPSEDRTPLQDKDRQDKAALDKAKRDLANLQQATQLSAPDRAQKQQQEDIARLQAQARAGDDVSQAQTAVNVARYQLNHAANPTDYYNALKALHDAEYQYGQARASLAAAIAQADVYPGAAIEAAQAQITAARDQLHATVPGTTAYYTALGQLNQAQVAYANALVQYHATERLLGIDITDPVATARAQLQTATDQLNSDRSQHAPREITDADQLKVNQDKAAYQKAAFDQQLQDVQTNYQLGRTTYDAYISYLNSQHEYLSSIAHRTRQQQDELNQVDQLLKDAANQMESQFNLGDIKLPTVYEERRALQGGLRGLTNNQTVSIYINGADYSKVRATLAEYLGPDATYRKTTSYRKV